MKFFSDMALVFRREWRLMRHDVGLLIFFLALPLLYPIVYTLIYNPEVVRQVPVVVVDDSRTAQSRELVRQASAAPAFKLYGYASNMQDAKEMWANQEVYAILHIPSDFAAKVNQGEQAHTTLYCDMSLLLRYRQLLSAMTSLSIKLASDITEQRVEALGAESTGLGGLPVQSEAHFLGDTQQGFASFVIPGIVVLILQQSMILGIGLLGGTARERRRSNNGIDPEGINGANAYATVWGKALAYFIIYIPLTLYILHFVPEFFHLPHYGSPWDYMLFMVPFLLASAFLGQIVITLIYEREYVFLVIVFTSVVFLFLSGLTWPRYAMPAGWHVVGNLVPATWGLEGFIRINSNAATLAENMRPYIALWIQAIAYSVLAALCYKWILMRDRKDALKNKDPEAPTSHISWEP